jgi:hypothetical protein
VVTGADGGVPGEVPALTTGMEKVEKWVEASDFCQNPQILHSPLSARSQMLAEKGKEKVEKEKQARENDTHQINAGLMRDHGDGGDGDGGDGDGPPQSSELVVVRWSSCIARYLPPCHTSPPPPPSIKQASCSWEVELQELSPPAKIRKSNSGSRRLPAVQNSQTQSILPLQ